MGNLTEELLDALADQRHPRGSSDQDDFVNVRRLQVGIVERLPAGAERLFDKISGQSLELVSGELPSILACLVRKFNREHCLLVLRQPDLGPFSFEPDALHGVGVLLRIKAMLLAQLLYDHVGHLAIEIVASQVGVPVGCQDFENAVFELQDRNVKRATAEVIDGDRPLGALLESVR